MWRFRFRLKLFQVGRVVSATLTGEDRKDVMEQPSGLQDGLEPYSSLRSRGPLR